MEIARFSRAFLALVLAFGPGLEAAAPVWAGEMPRPVPARAETPTVSLNQFFTQIQNEKSLSPELRENTIKMIDRVSRGYGCDPTGGSKENSCERFSMSPNLLKAIGSAHEELKDKKADPALVLSRLFENAAGAAKWAYDRDVSEAVISRSEDGGYTTAIRQSALGRTLGYKTVVDLGYKTRLVILKKDDPGHPGQKYVSDIVAIVQKGAAKEQRALYSRDFLTTLKNVKKDFYDQCGLARAINNGQARLPETGCADERGRQNGDLSAAEIEKLELLYRKNRAAFESVVFTKADGEKARLIDYLKTLDELSQNEELGDPEFARTLDWKDLAAAQRAMGRFYVSKKTEELQKQLLLNIIQYLGQATNTSAAKSGWDLASKTPEQLQGVLDDFNSGSLSRHSWLVKWFGGNRYEELSARDVSPRVLSAEIRAAAALAYAARARKDAGKEGLSEEEQDQYAGQAQHWLNIAQNQIVSIQMENLAIQLESLKNDKFNGTLGLTNAKGKEEADAKGKEEADAKGKEEAERLAGLARSQYLPALAELGEEEEGLAFERDFQAVHQDLTDVSVANLYGETLRKYLRKARASLEDARALYLAHEFGKADRKRYLAKNSLLKELEGLGYQKFLDHLPPEAARTAERFEVLIKTLKEAEEKSDDRIRFAAWPMIAEADDLWAEFIINGAMPVGDDLTKASIREIQNEAYPRLRQEKVERLKSAMRVKSVPVSILPGKRFEIKRGRVMSAVQDLASRIELFTGLNGLDLIVRDQNSSEPLNRPRSLGEKISYGLNFLFNIASLGKRDALVKAAMAHSHFLGVSKAYQLLADDAGKRQEILDLMNDGKYNEAFEKIKGLDGDAADRFLKNYKADKMEKDPYDDLEFDSFMSNGPENAAAPAAQGVIQSLESNLKTYVLSYQSAGALIDTAALAVWAPFVGFFAAPALGIARRVTALGRGLQTAEIPYFARISRWVLSFSGGILERSGIILEGGFGNLERAMGIQGIGSKSMPMSRSQRFVQIARRAPVNTVKYAAVNAGVMGLASGGFGVAEHFLHPNTSQSQGYAQAFQEGALLGAAFGVQALPIMIFNPLQAAAFGSTGFGAYVRQLAVSPGPIGEAIQITARLAPKWSAGPTAAAGPWNALSQKALDLRMAEGVVSKLKGFSLGFVNRSGQMLDGALKFAGAQFAASELAEGLGYAVNNDAFDLSGFKDDDENGRTAHAQNTYSSFMAGQSAGQIAWLLIPTNAIHDSADAAGQKAEARGFSSLMSQGRGREIEAAADGTELRYDKGFLTMSWRERLRYYRDLALGRHPQRPSGVFKDDGPWREKALKKRLEDFSDAELSAVAGADRGQYARFFKFEKGADGALRMVEIKAPAEAANAVPSDSEERGDSARPSLPHKKLRGRPAWVADHVKIKGGLFDDKGPSPESAADLKIASDESAAGESAVSENPSKLSKTLSNAQIRELARDADLRLSDQAIDLARQILDQRLRQDKSLRAAIIAAENSAEIPAGRFGDAAVSGKDLENLKQTAAAAQIEASLGVGKWGNIGNAVLGRAVEKPAETLARSMVAQALEDGRADLARAVDRSGRLSLENSILSRRRSGDDRGAAELEKILRLPRLSFIKPGDSVAKALEALQGKIASLKAAGQDAVAKRLEARDIQLSSLIGDAAADSVIDSVDRAMNERIAKAAALGDAETAEALKILRRTIQTDALTQYADKMLADDFKAYQTGAVGENIVDLSAATFKSIWERGVFGRYYGTWKTAENGEKILEIPADRQLKDARGNPITGFRELQARQILATLKAMSGGQGRVFNLLKTSGGKTLLSFVMLDFLNAYARSRGRFGAVYLTTNGDLVSQTMDQYLALFNGRKPKFQLKTYQGFWAEVAEADKYGTPNPLERYDLVLDEYDSLALSTALSLGSFTGYLSRFPRLDPVQESLQRGADELKAIHRKYEGEIRGEAEKLGRREVDRDVIERLMKENPEFKREYDNLISRQVRSVREKSAYVESPGFRARVENIHSDFYKDSGIKSLADFKAEYGMTPGQFYFELVKSHRNAFGYGVFDKLAKKWSWGGVIGRQYGHPRFWIEKIFLGGLEALSRPDLAKLYSANVDPNRKEVWQYHNGVPMDNLDTPYRSYLELLNRTPLTLDFDSLTQVDFKGFNEKARFLKTAMLALSGTLAKSTRPFMEKDMGFNVVGDESAGYRVRYKIVRPQSGESSESAARDFILKDVARARPDLAVIYADNKPEHEALEKALRAEGVSDGEITVGITPDSYFKYKERMDVAAEEYKNIEALKSGKAKYLILVGQAGFRGLDLAFKKYKDGSFRLYVGGSDNVATVNLAQLMGRIDTGRLPPGVKVKVIGVADEGLFKNSKAYDGVLRERLAEISGDPRAKMGGLRAEMEQIARDYALDKGEPLSEASGVPMKEIARLISDPKALEDPAIVEMRDLYKNYKTIKKLSGLVPARQAKEILDPAHPERLKALAENSKVQDILAGDLMAALQDQAERRAVESSGIHRSRAPGSWEVFKSELLRRFPFLGGLFGDNQTAPNPA